MVDEIKGPGSGWLDRLNRGRKAKSERAEGVERKAESAGEESVSVGGEMGALLERIRTAGTYRKERVHQVLEKLEREELVTSETVREAAERILREGP